MFKCVAVIGARQCGKTTLVRSAFPDKPYISLENPDTREAALSDPRGFLAGFPNGAIFDEAQRAPELFAYLEEILDNSTAKGQFILTGFNNFLLQEIITQSLAGRVGYLEVLPFSLSELALMGPLPESDDQLMLQGFYPPVHDQQIPAQEWCPAYLRTYVERDVRQLKGVTDLLLFSRFMRLLAGRHGQELNMATLGIEAGVDAKTVLAWTGILEQSHIIFMLRAYHRNFNKTVIKRPKLYFTDSALVCSLLGIRTTDQLALHPTRGAIFEGMVVAELRKHRAANGTPDNMFHWRSKAGHEVDLILDDGQNLLPIELKSGRTYLAEHARNLRYWMQLAGAEAGCVLFGGATLPGTMHGVTAQNWREFEN